MSQTAAHLSPSAREAVAAGLNQSLAETVVATVLAQNFHWNVTGMSFGPLHALFQTIYEDHFAAQDDLAERARAIDMAAGGSLASMLKRSKVGDHDGQADSTTMIRAMLTAQETLAATVSGLAAVAEQHGDLLTQDLAIQRGQTHEKFAWMLRSHLQ
jgi:starvation-inducible DNA-binding protein